MANGKNNHPQLSLCGRQSRSSASMPAAPEAIGLLRMLLSQPTADLQAITETIESDLGLMVRLFQLAAQQPATVPAGVFDVSEIVVHLGLRKLRTLIVPNMTLPAQPTRSQFPS